MTPSPSSGWQAGAVKAPINEELALHVRRLTSRFRVAEDHRRLLSQLGSQIVYASSVASEGFIDCSIALVRFSGAIEAAFGFTREIPFFYSPHRDLQIRTYHLAQSEIRNLPREVTPDIMMFWAPDPRLREKLDDWSSGRFLAIPLTPQEDLGAVGLVALMRDYIFTRDLFYETTPVRGDRFFGRRQLLQALRDDIRNQRVAGLYGLRKAGKTSVLAELSDTISSPERVVVLRDLESLPSPPDDPIPDLIRDLTEDLRQRLKARGLRTQELARLSSESTLADFKRALQAVLRAINEDGASVVLMLDEIEYLTPSDRIDVAEGDMTSVAQFLGVLRSLVQENPNFTFVLSGLTSAITESGRLYGRPNPLFSWAKSYYLSPFTLDEASELARSTGAKMGIEIEPAALAAVFEASGGHAYLYRHFASRVVEELPVEVYQRTMRHADVLRASVAWRRSVAGNIQEIVEHVRRYYPDEAFLLDILREDPSAFLELSQDVPQALEHLVSLGLIQLDGHEYELNPLLQLL